MAETISLEVKGKVPEALLRRLYAEVTPQYLRGLMEKNGMSTDNKTVEDVTFSYEKGFPTQDLALKAVQTESGMKFWGITSGGASRNQKVSVKYLILQYIQDELKQAGIQSELNIADLNPETIRYMELRRIFKNRLPQLRKIAELRGNLENVAIGAYAALQTRV